MAFQYVIVKNSGRGRGYLPTIMPEASYKYHFTAESMQIIWLTIIGFVATWIVSVIIERLMGFEKTKAGIFRNAVLFNNCGNIGVPLTVFIYSNDPFLQNGQPIWLEAAIAVQIVVFVWQNIVTNSLAFYFAGEGKMSRRDAAMIVFKMPIIYTLLIALGLNFGEVPIEGMFIWPVMTNISNALVMIALFTLGVQLARTPFTFFTKDVMAGTWTRLLLGPLIMWLCIVGYQLVAGPVPSLASQVLIISAAVPSGVTTALIAAVLKTHADYATQMVVSSTVLSAITLPIVIWLCHMI